MSAVPDPSPPATGAPIGTGVSLPSLTELLGQGSDEPYRRLVDSVEDYAIFLLTPEGHVASWNPGAQRIKGYRASEIIGRHFSQFYTDDALARGWPAEELRRAARDGRLEDEGWRLRSDGSRFWANVVITALRAQDGRLLGYSKVTQDLTERRAQQQRVEESERTLRLLVRSVVDYALYSMDADGLITSWNAGAERIKGYAAAEVIGRSFAIFYLPEDVLAGAPQAAMRRAAADGHFESEGWRLRKDGSRLWAATTVSAIRDESGRLIGFSKVTRDLTEHKRAEKLEIEGQRVATFIASLSHELRNPLAPIRHATSILKTGVGPTQTDWCLDLIGRQVDHLARLVDDLLDVSRIARGKIRLIPAAIDLGAVVSAAVDSLGDTIRDHDHRLELRLPVDPLILPGDATRLTQVVVNLVTNAARYTPSGGRLVVTVEAQPGVAVLRVGDNGIGMSADFLQRAFDPFTQGERPADRADGGLGIGLALVKAIVELHGGTVVAESSGAGRGTTVTVRLPQSRDAGHDVPADGPSQAATAADGSRQRILVVDDTIDAAETLAMLLRLDGHEVSIAHDGEQALALAAVDAPDVVLMDIGLPRMDGYEVARRLKLLPGLERARLVAITGYGQESDRRAALAAGFSAHLTKPVGLKVLQQVIRRAPLP